MRHDPKHSERVVITGIGLTASVGDDRETVWHGVRNGHNAMRRLSGLTGIPDNLLIGAPVDIELDAPDQLKVLALCNRVSDEAMADAQIEPGSIDPGRFGCAISAHMGDMRGIVEQVHCEHMNPPTTIHWRNQWLPNTACSDIGSRHNLLGPRLSHSTACASGLIAVLTAVRSIQDNQCDLALAGSAEAITPLFAAGFHQMKVLADHDDPRQACRPFDMDRQGFVMGEGAAMFVLERMSHALQRGAKIYAEVAGGRLLAMAHHVTSLDADSDALVHLITETLRVARLAPHDIGYINVHGTATQQNDVTEAKAIRKAMGRAADALCASATKSILGHLVNAAGSVELAITALALRDGFVPPTLNLTRPDPECDLDCIPLVGRKTRFDSALKLSVAFGGTLAAVALHRPDLAQAVRRPLPLAAQRLAPAVLGRTFAYNAVMEHLRILYLLSLLAFFSPALALAAEHTPDSIEKVRANLDQKKAVLIDVREPGEWKQGHLADAQLVPLSEIRRLAKDASVRAKYEPQLPKDKIIYCHCGSGVRVISAAHFLKQLGYDIRPLAAGYTDLLKAGFRQAAAMQ